MTKFKSHMLRTTALMGAAGAIAALSANPAQAAVFNSLNNVQAAPAGSACRISWDVNVTGEPGDMVGNDDFYLRQITDLAGNQIPGTAGQTELQTIGVTSTFSLFVDVTIAPGTQRYDKYIKYTDFGATGSSSTQTIIPDNVLQAAGGACLNLIANNAPTVDAGSNASTNGLGQVTLAGTASDIENDPLTYQWTQIAGPAVTLAGSTTLTPSFTAPPKAAGPQILTFSLAANDGMDTSTDTVEITVNANVGPTANAGPDAAVGGGTTGTLDGTGSTDGDGDTLTYSWTQTGGPAVTLTGASTANPTFTAPAATTVPQTLTFELVVNDGLASSAPDIVEITIPDNAAPVVNAGQDATATGGTTVTLSGTATDLENDPLTYQWTQTAGPSVTLGGPNTLTPSFVAPPKTNNAQVLTFSLVANDGNSASAADTVDITIAANNAPTAGSTAASNVTGGGQFTYDASGNVFDPDGDPLTFQWTQVSGPLATLTQANSATLELTAPPKTASAQTMIFELVVNDGLASSAPFVLTVTIPANQLPTADAGPDQTVNGGSTVMLDGSLSIDFDNEPLTFAWVQTSGPSVTLNDPTIVTPTFAAPAALPTAQTLTFDVTVTDGFAISGADSVTITIAANAPPVADAGADQGPINSGDTVTLDGSGSSDPDNNALTYQWTQISGPIVTLSDPTSATPSFVAPVVQGLQDVEFQLVVNDGTVDSAPDTVVVSLRGVGTITIIQRVIGSDTSFAFTSDIADLNGSIGTSGGTGQRVATGVAAGPHTVTVADLSAAGYALTEISCNDSDSVANLASRTVALALSPNEDLVCTFTSANSREAAVTAINNFLTGRNALILSMQPDLQRRLDRLNPTQGAPGSATAYGLPVPASLPFNMQLSSGQARFATSLSTAAAAVGDPDRGKQPFDIWTEAYFASARIGSQDGNFRIIHAGADYRVSKDLLLGILAQFDDFNDKGTLDAGEAEGDGWMVGPYAMARLAPGLFGEVRAAWGKSDNRLSPLGTYVDGFETNRSLYSGSLIGQFDLSETTQIRPEFTVRHLGEKAKAYTDSLNITIPGQTVGQGDISFRPRVQHLIELKGGWSLRPFGELEGIYTFGTGLNDVLENGLRARVEGGVDLFGSGSFRSSLSAFHDGIGSDNYRSTGIHLAVSFGF